MNGVSLVMATLGRVKEVERFVACLQAQTNRNFELIVVDQNPDDRLVPILKEAVKKGISTRHIRQSLPNQCLARNTGLANASMHIVAFPDDDCWYEADTLEVVLSRMSAVDAPAVLVIRWYEQDHIGRPAHVLDYSQWRMFSGVDASMITQFYRKDLFETVDSFDLALGLHSWFGGAEETDLMLRILQSGAKVVYTPAALVHHTFYSVQGNDHAHAVDRAALALYTQNIVSLHT
jgi:glycosyltransferase involved in cell wall biosynthesis